MTEETKLDEFADRHEQIHEQLELMEGWLEGLPFDDIIDRKRAMVQIVEFLERYVVVDVTWEEQHLFPLIGDKSAALAAEHRYIGRWVKELAAIAREEDPEATLFRRTGFKLFGLLEAHMDCEESLIEPFLKNNVPTHIEMG